MSRIVTHIEQVTRAEYEMAAKLNKMNTRDARFWQAAFVAAEVPALLKLNPKRAAPEGAAHLAAEYADAATREYRRRFR